MDHELSAARDNQRQIVPSDEDAKEITNWYGCEIAAHYQPSSELGGDFWGIRNIDENRFIFFTADFLGHSVAPSLNTFRLDAIIKEMEVTSLSPADFLANIKASLYTLLETGQFATMLCAIIEPKNDRLVYAGAAARNPYSATSQHRTRLCWTAAASLLGVRESSTYEDKDRIPKSLGHVSLSDALFESPELNEKP